MNKIFIFSLFLFCCTISLWAQTEIIKIENPSFEDDPRPGWQPDGWLDAGFLGESPPDVQPFGGFGVTQSAQDKDTYLGLVVRDNKTYEAVCQKLSKPMKKGQCYKFSIFLAKSERYVSPTKKEPNQLTNFNRGAMLRIFGGNSPRDKSELLAITEVIEHTDWREYKFDLKPKNSDYNYIFLESYYKIPTMFYYNGNILLDNASNLVGCKVEDPSVANADKNKNINKKPGEDNISQVQNNEENRGAFKPDIKASELKIGYIYELENLYFQADSSNISREAEIVLYKLIQFLKYNPGVSIEVGGHTNNIPTDEYCDRLSTNRAKKVADYISRYGVDRNRITYRGYGKRKPIADNNTNYGKQRNQRVEIKITGLK
jgi:outer membrane protein OmpA-like peptidoglycan-associated protein